MTGMTRLVYWEGMILLGGLFGVISWRLLKGEINLSDLLYGDSRVPESPSRFYSFFSAGRTQLLMITILTAAYYLLQVIHDPTKFPKIPDFWLVAMGGSHAAYLGGKAQSMLFGRLRDLVNRSTP